MSVNVSLIAIKCRVSWSGIMRSAGEIAICESSCGFSPPREDVGASGSFMNRCSVNFGVAV